MKRYMFAILTTIAFSTIIIISSAAPYDALKVAVPPTIDGDLSDWSGVPELDLGGDTWEANGGTWDNEADLSMILMIVWDDGNLYVASLVKDEAHINTQSDAGSIWNGDCVQYMVDPTGNRTDTTDVVYEFGYALAGANSDTPMSSRWLQNSSAPAFDSEFAVVRDDSAGTTTYEVCLPEAQIAPADLAEGAKLGFGAIANDGDPGAEGQAGWVGWGSHGIVFGKDATSLEELTLSGAVVTAVQPAGKLARTWGFLKVSE